METWSFDSRDAEDTLARGAALGRSIGPSGLALALVGPLGAGKTVFVKGLAEGLGVDPRVVSSPTFVIAQQYGVPEGPKTLHHVDLYRLESSVELESVGFFDMLGEGQVVAVEWADRFPGVLGSDFLSIEFEGPTPEEAEAAREEAAWRGRRVRVRAHGETAELILRDWAERVDTVSPQPGSRVVATPEMRVLTILAITLGAFVGSGPFGAAAPSVCADAFELEADSLGSLRVGCGSAVESEAAPLTGIGRLLDGGAVDLNEAPAEWLERLPRIGPARAAAIVAERVRAPFASLRDLERVRGIGPRTRAAVERWLFVAPSAGRQATS